MYAGAKSRRDEWVAGRHTALGTPQEKFCGMTVGQGQQEGDAGVDGGESGGSARADGMGGSARATDHFGGHPCCLQVDGGRTDGRTFAEQLSEATATLVRAVHGIEDVLKASLLAAARLEIVCRAAVRARRPEAPVLKYATGPGQHDAQAWFSGVYKSDHAELPRSFGVQCRRRTAARLTPISHAAQMAAPRRYDPGGCHRDSGAAAPPVAFSSGVVTQW